MKNYESIKHELVEYWQRRIGQINSEIAKIEDESVKTGKLNALSIYENKLSNIDFAVKEEIVDNISKLARNVQKASTENLQRFSSQLEFIEKYGGIDAAGKEKNGTFYFKDSMIFFGMTSTDLASIVTNIYGINDKEYDDIVQNLNARYGVNAPTKAKEKEALAQQMVEAMANNQLGTDGQPIVENQVSNGRQMGFAGPWLIGLATGIITTGIIFLGTLLK